MIPTKKHYSSTGSLGGMQREMSIDPSSMPHIADLLANLYSNIKVAVLREIACNAYDSHILAGNTDPIEITLPSKFTPYLVIKDNGVGMSPDELMGLYTSYGASTKRETNDATGMLGVGRLSVLAYTSTFTLVAVKDGIKSLATVGYGENGVPVVELVHTEPVDEGNSFEVSIPAKDNFKQEAEQVLKYWPKGSALVNGVEYSNGLDDAVKITDRLYKVESNDYYSNSEHIVMGNIAYAVNLKISKARGTAYVLFVDMGEVDFTPSREQLKMTPRTISAVKGCEEYVRTAVVQYISDAISNADNHYKAVCLKGQYKEQFGETMTQNVTYKGEIIPRSLAIDHVRYKYGKGAKSYRTIYLNADALFVYGVDNVTNSLKNKATSLLEYNGDALFFKEKPDDKWIKDARWMSREELKAVKGKKVSSSIKPSNAGKLDYWDESGVNHYNCLTYDPSKKYAYIHTGHRGVHFKAVGEQGYIIIQLSANRINKFVREWGVVDAHEILKEIKKEQAKAIDPEILDVLRYEGWSHLSAYTWCTQIEDQQVCEVLKIISTREKEVKEASRLLPYLDKFDRKSSNLLFERYPLIADWHYYKNKTPYIEYMNLIYREHYKGE